MATTPSSSVVAKFRPFATQLQLLMITLVVLSIGILCALVQVRHAHATTLGRLRSTWFGSFTDSTALADSGPRS
jgi:hypothetical protein